MYKLMSAACVQVANWIAHPLAIIAFPLLCLAFYLIGGDLLALTTVLSIMAISLTQMVLRSQEIEMEKSDLQMAELIKASPKARNVVISSKLEEDKVRDMKKEIEKEIDDEVSKEL